MKLLTFVFATVALCTPVISQADTTPTGLWEVTGFSRISQDNTTVSALKAKTKKVLLPINPRDSVAHLKRSSAPLNLKKSKLSNFVDTTTLPNESVVMHVCFNADGTWDELDYGIEKGQWTRIGDQITLSGNDPTIVANSATLQIIQPEISMAGTLQFWAFIDPQSAQDVYGSSWTQQSTTCDLTPPDTTPTDTTPTDAPTSP